MAQFGANRVYQDFEPFFEWEEDQGSVTLTIMLPGFRRDQLKVQVTSTPVLRINGEREVTRNVLRRFSREFSIPSYCDTNNVTAKFERGTLLVKFPKIETPASATTNDKPQEQEHSKNEQQQQQQQQKVAPPIPQQEASSQEGHNNNNNNDQQKPQQKEKEEPTISDEKVDQEKKSKEPMQSSKEAVPNSEVVGGGDKKVIKENAESNNKVNERKGARIAERLKTRMLDFTLSVTDEKDVVGQGYGGNLVRGVIKRPNKMLMNIVVAILFVMVLGIYVKHALWSSSSSSSSQGGSEFQEF